MLPLLPRLFLDLFWSTSLVAERPPVRGGGPVPGGGPGADGDSPELCGFLVGVLSPSDPAEAYVHFVGVAPAARRSGLAERLYSTFFRLARDDGRRVVRAVTSPSNEQSIAFHAALGFAVTGPVPGHNGPGTEYVCFDRPLP